MRVGLVGCVKSKLPFAAPARDLYTSPLFEGGRRAVEAGCERWFILSAKHGLLAPDAVIEPYDETLATASVRHRRAWSRRVLEELIRELGVLSDHTFEIHAGAAYYAYGLRGGLEQAGARVVVPTEGLAMGNKLAYYASGDAGRPVATSYSSPSRNAEARPPSGRASASGVSPPRGKYRPLFDYLQALPADRWDASFDEIEAVLGTALPASARRHPPWWANERTGTHSHARAWLAAGFETSQVRLDSERVILGRTAR